MDSFDKTICIILGLIVTLFLGLFICRTVYNIHENDNQLKEFEAATKAGLIQRVDPPTGRTTWVKPNE